MERERPHIRLRDGRAARQAHRHEHEVQASAEAGGAAAGRFHDLRHTCATLLLTRNVNPKIVSEMRGHSTIAITLDTYSHVLPNMRDAAAAAMEEALS